MALLAGKTALVTGSTQGIGYSILRALALAGCEQGALRVSAGDSSNTRDTPRAAPSSLS
jgi:NAD(P)-dependent dehydrogenase (short-subunit alcohol dehydrogenase family)